MTPQAQQIVDRFKPYFVSDCLHLSYCKEKECTEPDGSTYCYADLDRAIQCAIVAVEMQMEIAEICMEAYTYNRLADILTELKNEL